MPNPLWKPAGRAYVVGRSPSQNILVYGNDATGQGVTKPYESNLGQGDNGRLAVSKSSSNFIWNRISVDSINVPKEATALLVTAKLVQSNGLIAGLASSSASVRAVGETYNYSRIIQSVGHEKSSGDREGNSFAIPLVDGEFELSWYVSRKNIIGSVWPYRSNFALSISAQFYFIDEPMGATGPIDIDALASLVAEKLTVCVDG